MPTGACASPSHVASAHVCRGPAFSAIMGNWTHNIIGHLGLQADRYLVVAEDTDELPAIQPGCVYMGTGVWEGVAVAQTAPLGPVDGFFVRQTITVILGTIVRE